MTKYKYIPIDYFTYNRPDYCAAVITLILFGIFYVILYWIFKYESNNRKGICDPRFYYGDACRNLQSNKMLLHPEFLTMKKSYYDRVAKFNEKTKEYEGVRERTQEGKDDLEQASDNIQSNLDSNTAFGKDSVDELKKISTISQLIASKYLGNMKSLLENAPKELLDNLRELPIQIGELKNQIQATIINPTFASYTAPMQKLYKSLTEIDEKTLISGSPAISN